MTPTGPSTPTPWPPATPRLWTGEAGDAAGARDQLAALLPIRERVLGPEHPDTLTTRHELARWTGQAGDAAGARDQFAALLPISERVLGPEHPDTLTARGNLAAGPGRRGMRPGPATSSPPCCPSASGSWAPSTRHPDRPRQPRPLDRAGGRCGRGPRPVRRPAALRERVLGAEHPDTLSTRANLAYWTGRAGDAAGARDQFAALLPIRERVLGPEHPDTLTTRANLAYWTGQAGDAAPDTS